MSATAASGHVAAVRLHECRIAPGGARVGAAHQCLDLVGEHREQGRLAHPDGVQRPNQRAKPQVGAGGVAQALGVAPMTLYTYVPGRAELLDLMLDAVHAQAARRDTAGRPWRERLTAVAEENRSLRAQQENLMGERSALLAKNEQARMRVESGSVQIVAELAPLLDPSLMDALPALLIPVILLVGIRAGVMTPTEAAAVAARTAGGRESGGRRHSRPE